MLGDTSLLALFSTIVRIDHIVYTLIIVLSSQAGLKGKFFEEIHLEEHIGIKLITCSILSIKHSLGDGVGRSRETTSVPEVIFVVTREVLIGHLVSLSIAQEQGVDRRHIVRYPEEVIHVFGLSVFSTFGMGITQVKFAFEPRFGLVRDIYTA